MTASVQARAALTLAPDQDRSSAVTLPVEIYSEKRIREFDEAEADLAKVLKHRSRPKKTDR